MSTSRDVSRITVTPKEAAAVHRLLDAYVVTDDTDPGLPDLRAFLARLGRHRMDHSAYEADRAAHEASRGVHH